MNCIFIVQPKTLVSGKNNSHINFHNKQPPTHSVPHTHTMTDRPTPKHTGRGTPSLTHKSLTNTLIETHTEKQKKTDTQNHTLTDKVTHKFSDTHSLTLTQSFTPKHLLRFI